MLRVYQWILYYQWVLYFIINYIPILNEPRHDNPFTLRASASGHENLYILSCVLQAWITHAGWESLSVGEEVASPWSRSVMAWRSVRTGRMKGSRPTAHVSTNRFLGIIHTQRKRTRTSSLSFATTKGLFTRNAEVTVFLAF